ncbi:unnamed protein product [Paramecium sonneborni]|uniref:EF-hand domain-containing protein n=1 Tax=Paramecium sonneborni TaxID=65129 RepID=A0A8S1RIK6_9CILI|nr:unnamed protein product [Paramecium sonneborni]
MTDNLDKYYKLHHPEFLSEGMQLLREYIYYCKFDFIELCSRYDQFKDGTIQEKVLRDVLVEVSKSQFYFTEFDIASILKEAPYSSNRNIDYKELYKYLTECVPPKNSYHVFKNAIIRQKQNSASNKLFLEEIQKHFEEEVSNYFDRKAIYDFKHFNLNLLDLELLSTNAINIIFDDVVQEKMANFSKHNNTIILENFQILIAKKISIQALPQLAFQFIAPEKIEMALFDFLGIRRNQKMFPFLMKEQFIQLMKVKLYNVEMTYDECSLLYYLIWKRNNFGEFNLLTFVHWIMELRPLYYKEIIKMYDAKQPHLELAQLPKIFKEFQEMASKYTTNMLSQAFKPFQSEGLCTLENLKIVIRSLEIGYSQLDFNEFRYYLANHGLFTLSKHQQLLLKVQEFLQTLVQENFEKQDQTEMTDLEKAYQTLFKSIMLSILIRYEDKAQKMMQADQLIDEVQLRKIINEDLLLVDQTSVTMIIQSLEHNKEPSYQQPLRMIYFPEFIDKLRARFNDDIQLPGPQLVPYDKPGPNFKELEPTFNYKEGQFVRDPDKAFSIKPLDDREVLEKLKRQLIQHFKIEGQNEFEKSEKAVYELCLVLKDFDKIKCGNISKELLFEILRDLTELSLQEINNIMDFAMGVSKVDEDQFSYQFFCVQLNEFYQKHQLILAKR